MNPCIINSGDFGYHSAISQLLANCQWRKKLPTLRQIPLPKEGGGHTVEISPEGFALCIPLYFSPGAKQLLCGSFIGDSYLTRMRIHPIGFQRVSFQEQVKFSNRWALASKITKKSKGRTTEIRHFVFSTRIPKPRTLRSWSLVSCSMISPHVFLVLQGP